MYCIKCGKKNLPDFAFCYSCGTPLVRPAEKDPGPNPQITSPGYHNGAVYKFPPARGREEIQRYPVAPNGKPFIVLDHPEAFINYKNKDGKQVYAAIAALQARMSAVLVDTFICYYPLQVLAGFIVLLADPALLSRLTLNTAADTSDLQTTPDWVSLLVMTLYMLYCIVLTWLWNGQTLGKKLMKIKVIHQDGGKPKFQAVLRRNMFGYCFGLGLVFVHYSEIGALIGLTLIALVGCGFGVAFTNAKHQGWHDWLAETLVVGQRELVEGVNY